MFNSLRAKWIVIFCTMLLAAFWISPNFIDYGKDSTFGKSKLILGLDIQGGSHLVMGVNVEEVIQERVARMTKDLVEQFRTDGIQVTDVQTVGDKKTEILVSVEGPAANDQVVKFIEDRFTTVLQVVSQENNKILLKYFDATILEMKNQVVSQSIEVIRNRIDEFGVAEPSITAQGEDRILVQLPGVQDASGAKELINRTAKLDFRVVSTELPFDKLNEMIAEAEKKGNYKLGDQGLPYSAYIKRLNQDLASQLPKNTRLVFEKLENAETLEAGRQPYLIETDSVLGGAQLEDASVRPDEFGKPEVNFRFTVEGRRLFADLTQKAAGGFIAIVLDDVVKSAPSVREQIDSDSARITLGGARDYNATLKEATFIATALRAGALPAALEQLEERTVGPSLGSDSIKKAELAAAVGALLVAVFMIIFYRGAGLIADIALVLNILFTFAILTTIGATLTLPGIAGIALTVGMAVDANIIIFERIKEELKKGGSLAFAVKDGFDNAFSAIFDSNITTVLTCVVLMYYGTGPIRGFAVTLTIGIICSMFTAIFVSRTIIETLITKFNVNLMSASGKRA